MGRDILGSAQTGTGKTTTIMGAAQPKSRQGVLLRLMSDLFDEAL